MTITMCNRNVILVLALVACLYFPSGVFGQTEPVSGGQAQSKPLRFGILPYLSPTKLLQVWDPFIKHLEKSLGKKVIVVSAPSYDIYIKRAAEGRYDLYHTAPHFAALAEKQHNYKRVAKLSRQHSADIVVMKNSPYKTLSDLKGKRLATPSRLAILTMLGEQTLQEQHIIPGVDIFMKYTPSHNTSLLSVIEGTADAAVTSAAVFERMKPENKRKLRLLAKTIKCPHMMFMANPHLPINEYEALKKSVHEFKADGAGKQFFDKTRYGDMVMITNDDMLGLQPIVEELSKRIE